MLDAREHGHDRAFTLVELMVAIAIIAVVAALAVPVLTENGATEGNLDTFMRSVSMDIRRMRYDSIAQKDERAIEFTSTGYTLYAVTPGYKLGDTTYVAELASREYPEEIEVYAVMATANTADNYTAFTGSNNLPREIRFSGTNALRVGYSGTSCGSAYAVCIPENPATIYFRTTDDKYKKRIVIYRTTGYAKSYVGW